MADMITAAANPAMKRVRLLLSKSRTRKEEQAFVIEGLRLYLDTPDEFIEETYVTTHFLRETDRAEGETGVRLRDKLRKHRYQTVAEEIFSRIADTGTPQGILCVVKMPVCKEADLTGSGPVLQASGEPAGGKKAPLLLVLEDIQDPGNLGTMFRTAEAAGVTGILMSRNTVDLFNPKTVRATMSSIFRVPFAYTEDLQDSMEELKKSGVRIYAAHLSGQKMYDSFDYGSGTAFLIGNEGSGLTEATASLADDYLRIPMEGRIESLNAAMAAGILVYEAYRQRRRT
jgi:TrmH family RNA methyltransferase